MCYKVYLLLKILVKTFHVDFRPIYLIALLKYYFFVLLVFSIQNIMYYFEKLELAETLSNLSLTFDLILLKLNTLFAFLSFD